MWGLKLVTLIVTDSSLIEHLLASADSSSKTGMPPFLTLRVKPRCFHLPSSWAVGCPEPLGVELSGGKFCADSVGSENLTGQNFHEVYTVLLTLQVPGILSDKKFGVTEGGNASS